VTSGKTAYVKAEEIHRCSECGSTRLIQDSEVAEIVCMDCGCVVSERLADRGPEWRAFDKEQREKRARTGAPVTFTIHDKGLSTLIDWRDRDVLGRKIPSSQKAQLYRLRKWQRRIRVSDGAERNLAFALSEITKISNNLSLPKSIFETASVIYRKALKKRLFRGRSIQGISAASVYIACRQCGLARTLNDIAAASNISRRELGRSYRFLVNETNCSIPLIRPIQYVSRFSNQLELHGKVEVIASKILSAARELRLTSGRGPKGIAAAATYIASTLTGQMMTQREIAEIAQVTEVTIRNRYKEMIRRLLFVISL
jgi:transcription initiation factor TFIIB